MSVNKEEFVKKCEQIYLNHRRELESKYSGKLVALYEEGIAAIADSIDKALDEATTKHPGKIFYVRRIGERPTAAILYQWIFYENCL